MTLRTLLLSMLLSGAALAQGPITCVPGPGFPTVVRAGGKTELIPDLTLTCTGGTPTAVNAPVPLYTLRLQAKSVLLDNQLKYYFSISQIIDITSRRLTSSGLSEAILLIDEPHSLSNPTVPLLVCGDSAAARYYRLLRHFGHWNGLGNLRRNRQPPQRLSSFTNGLQYARMERDSD